MKYSLFALFLIGAVCALADQDAPGYSGPPTSAPSIFTNIGAPDRNSISFIGSLSGAYDTGGVGTGERGVGFIAGWGVVAARAYRAGVLSLNYSGDFRDFAGGGYGTGTDHNLSFSFSKMLNRHWSFSSCAVAGEFLQGASYYSQQASNSGIVTLTPTAANTKYASLFASLNYQQSRRLSYSASINYFLSRYGGGSGASSFGSSGYSATGSASYRVTARTTVSGNFSYSDYSYQGGEGTSQTETVYAGVGHDFPSHWRTSASGGVSRTSSSGFLSYLLTPALQQIFGTQYIVGSYHRVAISPYFQGSASKGWKRSSMSFNGGQSVNPGNGVILTAKNLFVYGNYSYRLRKSNLNFTAGYNKYSSISASTGSFSNANFSTGYSYNVNPYVGLNFRYDLLRYGSNLSGFDHRFTIGITGHTKSYPLPSF